jgi:signal transduction histidine kinase
MVASVLGFAATMLAYERWEFQENVQALQNEQVALATAIAPDFAERVLRIDPKGAEAANTGDLIRDALSGALALEQPRSRILLVLPPHESEFVATSGRRTAVPELERLLDTKTDGAVLSPEVAAHLGLPARIAAVGMSRVRVNDDTWGLAVLASAQRLRRREQDAQLRFLVGLGLVTLWIAGFGGLALRQHTRKLQVARELEVFALERDRDRLLAKADKMATLAALSSGIAHEIATPLGTIMARVEQVLPAVAHDAQAQAALRVALAQVERIQVIIQGLLALARGERSSRVQVRPSAIVHTAVALVEHRLKSAGVKVQSEVAADLEPVPCDQPLIEQAVANLLLNACDASPRGGVVRLRVQAQAGRLTFCVEDEGAGIAKEVAATVLNPFVSTKTKSGGTGLGLAIAQEIVSNHGGRLLLEPRAGGRGTRAIIELPET